jgi:hypothetical protein
MPLAADSRTDHTLGWRWACLVSATAIALRLWYLGPAAADPAFWHPYLDALWNLQQATAIAHGHLAGSEAFYRAPAYQYFLGGLLRLTGGSLLGVRIAQIILGSLTPVLVAILGARLFSRRVGAVAGMLCASAATLILSDLELLNSVLFLPLLAAALLALDRTCRQPSLPAAFVAGLLFGLAAITRPEILPLMCVGAGLAAVAARRHGWPTRRLAAASAVWGAAALLAVAPVTLHNLVVGRDFVLISSQGGSNFYIGNSAQADGYTPAMPAPTDTASYAANGLYTDNMESSSRFGARLALGHEPIPSEVSRYWTRRALSWIASEPRAWLRLLAHKAFYLIGGFEIGDQKNLAYFLAAWWPFTFLPRWWWLFPLALAGLTLPGDVYQRVFLAACAVTYGATIVVFVVLERYRLALYPLLCILAGRFLVWLCEEVRSRAWRPVILRLALAASVAVAVSWDPTGYTVRERVEANLARATARERRGDPANAERLYLDALTINPGSAHARAAYAAFLARHGRLPEARAVGGSRLAATPHPSVPGRNP